MFFSALRFEPGTAGSEARTLRLCYADPLNMDVDEVFGFSSRKLGGHLTEAIKVRKTGD